ncbi:MULTISPECIES: efflux RND transporter periplasmic adaptor subunit [Hymenobacter]|uniref:Membrane fusion protein, cobalt-zinc-cadmium efflux system n=1 Tax=Hymenobacter psychrotolerans DSM 18569 TaxID=1121959 RepID=A0A1M7A131_9BACT|nr:MULTISPECIES: efflux RND transporter periplasmic adaptor subunit [Hymenobacter]QNE42061.1 efflux RND transporter periplasmic adaptor subunit [Hymenobacter sp. NBH84]SHL36315.1 membrane fusion protein, cobalt-zinc-cadmium efflux system [Hymenobacter psychrotolerans DSM 18569]
MKTKHKVLLGTAAASLALTVLLPPTAAVFGHGGEDHGGEAKASTGVALTDEVLLPKESQFLFQVRTSLATYSATYSRATLYGTVSPAAGGEGRIVVPQTGRIVSLAAQVGQGVRAGQALAVIEQTLDATQQIGLSTERANAQAELRAAQQDYARLQSIADIAARKDVVAAELRLRQARQNAAILNGQARQRRVTITSPISGTVDVFNLAVGQQVGQGDELFRVLNPGKLRVEAQVFAQDLAKITPGAQFRVEGLQGQAGAPAKLVVFSNVVNPVNQARQLILELDQTAASGYRAGQAVNVQVLGQSEGGKKELVVPTSAVTDLNGKPVVFVHTEPEHFRIRYVQPGAVNGEQTVLLQGEVNENDRVVTAGTYQLKSIYLNQ